MANKSENADIREIQTKMDNFEQTLGEVKEDVKTLIRQFENYTNLQTEINNLKTEINELKARKTFTMYVTPLVSAIAASLLTFLVISFFQSSGKVDPQTIKTETVQTK